MNIITLLLKRKELLLLTTLLLVIIIGIIDYYIGNQISFSLFYLIPISIITWYYSKTMGIVLSIASAITWFIADLQTGHIYIHPIIPYWNTLMRFGFFLITTFLISNFKKAFDLEKKYSRIDNLTGIPNSRSFYEVVLKEIDISRRYKTYLSILYIDLDNFKLINDTQGHLEGDRLLRSVANHIKNNIRNMDSAARLGGDEFAVLLPHTEFGQAKTVAEKLRSALMDLMQQNDWSVTFSIGLASFIDPPLTVNEIIKKADDLMYSVKRNGKNNIKYEFYN